MRYLTIPMLLLAGLTPVTSHAAILSASFSGTWGGNLGVVHAGDAFSGMATWDAAAVGTTGCGGSPPVPHSCLSASQCPRPTAYPSQASPTPTCSSRQLDIPRVPLRIFNSMKHRPPTATAMDLGSVLDPLLRDFVCRTNCTSTTAIPVRTYSFVGPTAVPEPGTGALIVAGLVLFAGIPRRRIRSNVEARPASD